MRAYEARLKRVEDQVRRLLAERKARERLAGGGSSSFPTTPGGGSVVTASTYIHKQILASDVWIIEHNLGRFPSVTVVDSIRREYEGTVDYDNDRRLRVTFSAPFSGEAYLN